MERRDDLEFDIPDIPEDNGNKQNSEETEASGDRPEYRSDLAVAANRNGPAGRPFVSVRILQDTFEAKTPLQSPAELEKTKDLITVYLQPGKIKGAKIEILANPDARLLEDLKKFCASYKEEHRVPLGLRIVFRGRTV